MALSAGGEQEPVVTDHWDDSAHTPLENTMVAAIKMLIVRSTMSAQELQEFKYMFPILWGL